MRRLLLILAALVGAVPVVAAHASVDPAPPPLDAALESCHQGAAPEERVTVFGGSMPARAGATGMRMRFDLERRRPGERRWRRVPGAAGFGDWERSLPSRAGFIFHKRVVGLPVPASYRAVVSFVWERGDGTVAQRAQRLTAGCRQPDLRPDLRPGTSLTGAPAAQSGLALYALTVRNAGRSPSGPFSVRVGAGRTEVASLAAGEQRAVPVLAPVCAAGSRLIARVDESRRVDESHEEGNGVRLPCPLDGR